MWYRKFFFMALFSALLIASAKNASATILLDLEDPAGQSWTPFSLSFTATTSATELVIGGYQVYSYEVVEKIRLTQTAQSSELLGQYWNFSPATSGSVAYQFDDGRGTGAYGLLFAGVVEDKFDSFSQFFTTVSGQSYTLQFRFSNDVDPYSSPSGLQVSFNALTRLPDGPSYYGNSLNYPDGLSPAGGAQLIDEHSNQPIPAPSSLVMLVLGGLSLAAARGWLAQQKN